METEIWIVARQLHLIVQTRLHPKRCSYIPIGMQSGRAVVARQTSTPIDLQGRLLLSHYTEGLIAHPNMLAGYTMVYSDNSVAAPATLAEAIR